jgi:oligopeptide/dipeptide ABC transporter ATP-binding protein
VSGVPAPLLEARGLTKHFPIGGAVPGRPSAYVQAVDAVDLDVYEGETLGLVGESGCGKTTLGRLLIRLLEPTSGRVVFDGRDLTSLRSAELRAMRRQIAMIFQDPYASLDPRQTVSDIVGEAMAIHNIVPRRERRDRVRELLSTVGLDPAHGDRYPHEFSGGQRQRVGIARALATSPRLVVLDEPVSALDVSTQSQVVNLLADLQQQTGVAYLFIAHDLYVVHHVSHRIAVMYLGAIVEMGAAEQVYGAPRHPYTQALLSSILSPDPGLRRERIVLHGDIPSPTAIPTGCRFHTRCPHAFEPCATVDPPALVLPDGGTVACHLHTDGPTLAGASVNGLTIRRRDAGPPVPA